MHTSRRLLAILLALLLSASTLFSCASDETGETAAVNAAINGYNAIG